MRRRKADADPADAYDAEAAKFVKSFRQFVTENFGKRCSAKAEGCPCCEMWALYDQTRKKVIFK
jgi:hypothetical protein